MDRVGQNHIEGGGIVGGRSAAIRESQCIGDGIARVTAGRIGIFSQVRDRRLNYLTIHIIGIPSNQSAVDIDPMAVAMCFTFVIAVCTTIIIHQGIEIDDYIFGICVIIQVLQGAKQKVDISAGVVSISIGCAGGTHI